MVRRRAKPAKQTRKSAKKPAKQAKKSVKKPAKQTKSAKRKTELESKGWSPRAVRVKMRHEALEKLYGVEPTLIQIIVHDCRDCPYLQDFGPVGYMSQRRYGCMPLVLRWRAGAGDIDFPFADLAKSELWKSANWKPHPECPLGIEVDDD